MVELAPGVHHLKFPLRPGISGSMNLIVGSGQAGLVDTGTPPQPDQTLLPYLGQIGLDARRITAIVNTHWHGDHMGGNAQLVALTGASVAAHQLDVEWIERPIASSLALRARYGKYHPAWGQSEEEIAGGLQPASKIDRALENGDAIQVGERTFRVVHTPGHTPGSISLLDVAVGRLFSGDGLQGEGQWGGIPNYADVEQYLTALERVEQLDLNTIVTAHEIMPARSSVYQGRDVRVFLTMCRDTVDRLDGQVMEALTGGGPRPRTLGEITRAVLDLNKLDAPVAFAHVVCVNAHLERLVSRGNVRRLPQGAAGAQDEPAWTMAGR